MSTISTQTRSLPLLKTLIGPPGDSAKIQTLDSATGAIEDTLDVGEVYDLKPSPYHRQAVALVRKENGSYADDGYRAIVWPETGKIVPTNVSARWISDQARTVFSPEGSKIAFQHPTQLLVVNAHTGETILDKQLHLRDDVIFTPDGRGVIIPGHLAGIDRHPEYSPPTLEMIDLESGKTLFKQPSDLSNLAVTPQGEILGTSGREVVKLRHATQGLLNRIFHGGKPLVTEWRSGELNGNAVFSPPILSPDGERIAVENEGVTILSARTGHVLSQERFNRSVGSPLTWSKDGAMLAAEAADNRWSGNLTRVLDGHSLTKIAELKTPEDIENMAFRQDGGLVISLAGSAHKQTVITLDPRTQAQTVQEIHGAQVASLGADGEPMLLRQPTTPYTEPSKAEDAVALYHEGVRQARLGDNNFGDEDLRSGAFLGGYSAGDFNKRLQVEGLDTAQPTLLYEEEHWRKEPGAITFPHYRELQSEGTRLDLTEGKKNQEGYWEQQFDLVTGKLVDQRYRLKQK